MPVKRRKPKHKAAVPTEAWEMAFESGYDFFGDLEPLGVIEPRLVMGADRQAAQAAWTASLRAAWAEHGTTYLRARDMQQHARPVPWALEAFGDPATCL